MWGLARENWPAITFEIYPPAIPHASVGEDWIFEGRQVIDRDGRNMKNYRELPWVLSSRFEGFAMEAIHRLNKNITHQDFLSRMPGGTLQMINMRCIRFRERAGCIAWYNVRTATDTITAYLESIIPPENLAGNSTRSWRTLTMAEREAMRARGFSV